MFAFEGVPPEKAIAFTRNSIILTCCWPLPLTATASDKLRANVLRLLLVVNAILLVIPLMYAVYVHSDIPEEVARATLLIACVLLVLPRTVFCVYHHDRLQRVVEEMKSYCANASESERRVLQKYIDRYSGLYAIMAVWIYITLFIIIVGTFVTSDPMPVNAEYPFDIESQPLRSVIYLQQTFVGMQCASHFNLNGFSALLIFFAAARFEILSTELRDIESIPSLAKYIKKYHHIKRYAKEVITATRPLTVSMIATCTLGAVFSAIATLGRQPRGVKVQFFVFVGNGLLETFVCTLPYDRLMNMSEKVMYGLYQSKWYRQARRLKTSIIIGLAPQTPIMLKVPCLISGLTLNYYCSFVSNVFSLFTVFRAVMIEDD